MSKVTSWRVTPALVLGMLGVLSTVGSSKGPATGGAAGGPRLIAIDPLPEMDGEMCEWVPQGASARAGALQQSPRSAAPAAASAASMRSPVRVLRDPNASYSSVAVDPVRNEVVLTDENLHGLLVYDRLANTPTRAAFTEPKRSIGGVKTNMEYQCGVYIDPASGDIYSMDNDTHNTLVVFSRQAKGNVPPNRELYTPHGTFGIAVDETAQEMFLTVEHDNAMVVYRKMAQKDEAPLRLLQGSKTGLADPHGIVFDPKSRSLFVTNHGSVHDKVSGGKLTIRGGSRALGKPNWPVGDGILGSGRNLPPSITVYAVDARGDTPPLRTIQGPKTQLNWPMGIAFDPKRNEIHVANDMGQSVLIFSATASGDVAPVRVLKGPKSLIKNPTGVFIDAKNDELWVSNMGNHSATVFSPAASGDVAPLRVIRATPLDQPAPILGNPGAVTYDSRRDELLVPN